MAFDPNQYVEQPVNPDDEEKKQAQMQTAPAPTSGGFDPDAYLASPVQQPAPTTQGPQNAGDYTAGLGKVAYDLASEYGKPALEIGAAYMGAKKAFSAIDAYKQASNSKLYGDLLNNYSKLNHDIRQYEKVGSVPQELLDARARLGQQIEVAQSKIPGYNPNVKAPVTPPTGAGPVPPQATPTPGMAQAAGAAENVGAQAAGRTGMMQDLTKLYQKYGPALIDQVGQIGKAIGNSQVGQMAGAVAESPVGRLAGGALRVAGSVPVMGAQLGLYSSGLNQGEDEQMRQIHQQQDALRLKQNKTAPNAINSGFSQQLNSYSQQRRPQ
jgi:hypothetical protein